LPVFCWKQTSEWLGLLKKYLLDSNETRSGRGKNHMPVVIRQPLKILELSGKDAGNYITLHFILF
jgi:hypothetical protein